MMSAVHLSAMRSNTSREGHCASMTDPPEEDFRMAVFRRLPSQAQAESSNPTGSYRTKSTVVDGRLGLSIF
jgi:hypothetical protein